jgi:hypothetical protein
MSFDVSPILADLRLKGTFECRDAEGKVIGLIQIDSGMEFSDAQVAEIQQQVDATLKKD